MFLGESRAVVTEEREFHDKPQNYLCSLERDGLGHHLIVLVFPALLAKPCHTNDSHLAPHFRQDLSPHSSLASTDGISSFPVHTAKSAAGSIDHSIITLLYLISSSSFKSNSIADHINSAGNTLMDYPGPGVLQVRCKIAFVLPRHH